MNNPATNTTSRRAIDIVNASLKRRYARERRFRWLGATAVTLGMVFVILLFADIILKGYTAFQQTYIQLPVELAAATIDPDGNRDPATLASADYMKLIREALREQFPKSLIAMTAACLRR